MPDLLIKELQRAKQRRALPAPPIRRMLRERVGLSKAVLARALGIDRSVLARWESGERQPRDAAAYLGILERLEQECS
jgi:DNA-binding transcriptional regulator YiaG